MTEARRNRVTATSSLLDLEEATKANWCRSVIVTAVQEAASSTREDATYGQLREHLLAAYGGTEEAREAQDTLHSLDAFTAFRGAPNDVREAQATKALL